MVYCSSPSVSWGVNFGSAKMSFTLISSHRQSFDMQHSFLKSSLNPKHLIHWFCTSLNPKHLWLNIQCSDPEMKHHHSMNVPCFYLQIHKSYIVPRSGSRYSSRTSIQHDRQIRSCDAHCISSKSFSRLARRSSFILEGAGHTLCFESWDTQIASKQNQLIPKTLSTSPVWNWNDKSKTSWLNAFFKLSTPKVLVGVSTDS